MGLELYPPLVGISQPSSSTSNLATHQMSQHAYAQHSEPVQQTSQPTRPIHSRGGGGVQAQHGGGASAGVLLSAPGAFQARGGAPAGLGAGTTRIMGNGGGGAAGEDSHQAGTLIQHAAPPTFIREMTTTV